MADPRTLTKTIWLQIRPTWGTASYNKDMVQGIKIDKIYQNKPPRSAGTVVEITITVPDIVFKPLRPKIDIDIPLSKVDLAPLVRAEIEGLMKIADDTA